MHSCRADVAGNIMIRKGMCCIEITITINEQNCSMVLLALPASLLMPLLSSHRRNVEKQVSACTSKHAHRLATHRCFKQYACKSTCWIVLCVAS